MKPLDSKRSLTNTLPDTARPEFNTVPANRTGIVWCTCCEISQLGRGDAYKAAYPVPAPH
jgi:hypothetical protein